MKCQSALILHKNRLKETQPIRGSGEEVDFFSLVLPARVCMATPWTVSRLDCSTNERCSARGCAKLIMEWCASNFKNGHELQEKCMNSLSCILTAALTKTHGIYLPYHLYRPVLRSNSLIWHWGFSDLPTRAARKYSQPPSPVLVIAYNVKKNHVSECVSEKETFI